MKAASVALINYLNSNQQFIMADLYTFTLVGGFVARYADFDMTLTVGGNTYLANSIILERTATRTCIGVEVDTMEVTVTATLSELLNGVPWIQAANLGALDGASLQVDRLFMPTPGDVSLGVVNIFTGTVGGVEAGRMTAKLTVESDLKLLNIKMPRNLYQPGCQRTLFDAGCGLNKASWAQTTTVNGTPTKTSVPVAYSHSKGYYELGTIRFTSGVNSGIVRTIKSDVSNVLQLMTPLLNAPAVGDSCIIYPGCNKMRTTCQTKFNNFGRWRGFDQIPVSETAI